MITTWIKASPKIVLWGALILVSSLSSAQETAKKPENKGITQIILQRTECYGSCPVDRLVLNSDGTATYQGDVMKRPLASAIIKQDATPGQAQVEPPLTKYSTARMGGFYTAYLWVGTFNNVATILEQQGFFEMKPSDNQENIDSADVLISTRRDGLDYTVVRHGTSPNFWMLEKLLNGVGADLHWTKDEATSNNGIEGRTWREFNSAEKARFATSKIENSPVPYTRITAIPKAKAGPTFTTFADSRGHFQILLPPGQYMISASGDYKPLEWPIEQALPSKFLWNAETQIIQVEAGKFAPVKLRAKGENH